MTKEQRAELQSVLIADDDERIGKLVLDIFGRGGDDVVISWGDVASVFVWSAVDEEWQWTTERHCSLD